MVNCLNKISVKRIQYEGLSIINSDVCAIYTAMLYSN